MSATTSPSPCATICADAPRRFLVAFFLLVFATVAQALEAGRVQYVQGEVQVAAADGQVRGIRKGDSIHEGDTVTTGTDGWVQLRMKDDAQISLRPDSVFKIEAYRYVGKEDGSERGILGLVKGGFRTLTGWIGKTNRHNYTVRTPTATIGIRGTDHEPVFVPSEGGWAGAPGAEPGTYDKVNSGGTFIETAAGRIDLGPNQAGFVPPRVDAAPVKLDKVPEFFKQAAAPRAGAVPQEGQRKEAGGQKGDGRDAGDRKGGPRPPVPMPPPPPPPQPSPPPPDPKRIIGEEATQAPAGYALAGGDKSGPLIGSGSGTVGNGDTMTAILGPAGNPLVVGDNDGKFSYLRNQAPLLESGRATLAGTQVVWGMYGAGGTIFDTQTGQRSSDYFHFVTAAQALPQASIAGFSGSYSSVVAFTKPLTEAGLGASTGSVATNISISAGSLSSLTLSVTDSYGRSWSATNAATPSLSQFITSGVHVSGTGAGVALDATKSNVSGIPIGTTGSGLIGSYDLHNLTQKAVTGSFVAQ